LLGDLAQRIERVPAALAPARQSVSEAIDQIRRHFAWLVLANRADIEAAARHLAISLSRIISAGLLIKHAVWDLERENDVLPVISAKRWCGESMVGLLSPSETWCEESRILALNDGHPAAKKPLSP
jgi:hypothetical protein